MARKRRRNEIIEDFAPAFGIAGGAIGSSILGSAFSSKIPAGVSNPLTTTGTTLGAFVAPIAVIGVAGTVTRQLRRVQRKVKRRRL